MPAVDSHMPPKTERPRVNRATLDPTVAAMQQELEQLRGEVDAWRQRYAKGEKRDITYANSESEVAALYGSMPSCPANSQW